LILSVGPFSFLELVLPVRAVLKINHREERKVREGTRRKSLALFVCLAGIAGLLAHRFGGGNDSAISSRY
jgi:hypothetical protein